MAKKGNDEKDFRPLSSEECILATKLKLPMREMAQRRSLEEEASAFLNKNGFDKNGRGKRRCAAYMIFSPKYNTTEDYAALMPLAAGAVCIAMALIVWDAWALWKHFS